MHKLILLRHGQSEWNLENRFTGWTDVDLTPQGRQEALKAGTLIREAGLVVDVAYTSVLKRAIRTLWIVLDELDRMWIPVHRCWRLNERHYGALQGLNKADTAAKYGNEQVQLWRRSYDVTPPALERSDPRFPGNDARYHDLQKEELPVTECLKDTVERFMPHWHDVIAPEVLSGRHVLIAAHGNTLRALVEVLDGLSKEEVMDLNIPTGVPLVYELDDVLKPLKHYYLGDAAAAEAAAREVARQGQTG